MSNRAQRPLTLIDKKIVEKLSPAGPSQFCKRLKRADFNKGGQTAEAGLSRREGALVVLLVESFDESRFGIRRYKRWVVERRAGFLPCQRLASPVDGERLIALGGI